MLAAAASKASDDAAESWPELGLELGDPCLEIPDLPVETDEIDLADGGALDRVRGVVDHTGNAKVRSVLFAEHIPQSCVDNERPLREPGIQLPLAERV